MSHQPLDLTLRRVASEVAELTALAQHLETALDSGDARLDPRRVIEWQTLDMLTQRLAGLTQFLDALAGAAPPRFPMRIVAALEALPLADQAQRLAGRRPAPSADVGELTLFD
ncbi:MAG TPA: hypothetical protein VGL58_06560 [Caulobacteraceae bacterium]|jgi:hypothetical protein